MTLQKKHLTICTTVFMLLFCGASAWAKPSPMVMLEQTANNIIKDLQRSKATIKQNRQAVYSIVNSYLLPKVDVRGMSRSVLGGKVWKQADDAQKKRFSKEFTHLVVRTYAGALAQYTNEEVKFFPIRGGYQDKKRVQVKSIIERQNAPNIPISYRVVWSKSQWKIYDMSVEGVSLLQSFRSQFRSELKKMKLNALIDKLEQHNRKQA